jgi:hypothetical protein
MQAVHNIDQTDQTESDVNDTETETEAVTETEAEAETEWMVTFIDVPPDGSCFYWAIACALEASRSTWCQSLCEHMTRLQYRYQLTDEDRMHYASGDVRPENTPLVPITMQLIRLITAAHLTEGDLVQHNALAEMERVKVHENLLELQQSVANTQWANFTCIRSLLRALDYQIGLLIFDASTEAGAVSLPEEWMKNKPHYVILRREHEHYDLVEISRKDESGSESESDARIRHVLPSHSILVEALGENAKKFNLV